MACFVRGVLAAAVIITIAHICWVDAFSGGGALEIPISACYSALPSFIAYFIRVVAGAAVIIVIVIAHL
jgi:hypothetical protein